MIAYYGAVVVGVGVGTGVGTGVVNKPDSLGVSVGRLNKNGVLLGSSMTWIPGAILLM